MQKKSITKENEIKKYIWSLQGKCDGISKMNEKLIDQFCRYCIMAEDMSLKIREDLDNNDFPAMEEKIKIYEKVIKLQLALYKTLRFEQIKDELSAYGGNPFSELMKQEAENDDF